MMRNTNLVIGIVLLGTLGCGFPEDGAGEETWIVDHVEEKGALLSVWGSGPSDVWAAGGSVGEGLLLHNEGSGWAEVEVEATELLWWVYGFSADDVYAVGEGGLILHYDGIAWENVPSNTSATLYGVWGASGDEVWIVGGDPHGGLGSAVVLRGTSTGFEVAANLPSALLPRALFKVYGGPQEVVAVGSGGTVLRYENGVWQQEQTPTTQPIFSLWGRAQDDIYAVGGYGESEILHFDGQQWDQVCEENGNQLGRGLSGVFTAPDHPAIAVGADNYVVEILADGSMVEPELPILEQMPQLHGVWGDGQGRTYVVGGALLAYPDLRDGVILLRR